MSRYFVLECMAGTGPLHFKLKARHRAKEAWAMGRMFSAQEVNPDFRPPIDVIELEVEVDSKANERVYPELKWNPLPLMTRRLVGALRSAGVDNLQAYDTRLKNRPGKNPPPENHYLAVNIVGLIQAADLAKSKTNPDVAETLLSADFHSLAIDPLKARGALMFRLAENVTAVLVHERVKAAVEAAGITTLTWYDPESWAG